MAFNTASSQTSTHTYLPAPISNCLIPMKERERLQRWINAAPSGPVVGVIGRPGIGKSTLAADLAREQAAAGQKPVVFAHCRDRRLEAIAQECIHAIAPESPLYAGADVLRAFREIFFATPAIVVLDDLTDHHRVAQLATPNTIIVVTSREPLRVPSVELREWSQQDAIAYVAEHGQVNDNDVALSKICALVNHLPLALEMIAAFFAATPATLPSECLRWLSDEHRRLMRTVIREDDQVAYDTTFAFVYHRLAVTLQRVLRQLSVVPGPFDAAMAVAVSEDAEYALPELVKRRLIAFDSETGLYTWRAPVRAFVRARLSNSEVVSAELRHAACVVSRAREIGHRFQMPAPSPTAAREAGEALRAFDTLRHHIELVFLRVQPDHHALQSRAARLMADLTDALRDVLPLRLSAPERVTWLRAQAGAHRALRDYRGEVNALGYLAALHIANDDLDAALKCYERLLNVKQELTAENRSFEMLARVAENPGGITFEHLNMPARIAQALAALGAGKRVGPLATAVAPAAPVTQPAA